MEGLCSKPSESGQHEVVHESSHNLTTHRVLCICHKVVDQESEIKQEHGQHEVDQDPCGFIGLGLPVMTDDQRSHIMLELCAHNFFIVNRETSFLDLVKELNTL